jgi:C-terminal processing protease CtpA/Prc
VLKIGEKTPEQILSELAPYISHENQVWLRANAPGMLRPGAVLQHLGVMAPDGQVILRLQKPGGAEFSLPVRPGDPRTKMVSLTEALNVPTPLFRTHPKQYYWHQYLEDSNTLYVQYNVCANDPKLRFSDFADKVLADADSHKVTRVVIDMRQNGGGDSRVIRPLKNGLEQRLAKVGRVFVLIGPGTFSSGTDNAVELHRNLHATLIGEPTGGMPSSYGEVKYIDLPNSKLRVQYTSKWFGSRKDSEPDSLAPDVLAPRKLEDTLLGRDSALEAALAAH